MRSPHPCTELLAREITMAPHTNDGEAAEEDALGGPDPDKREDVIDGREADPAKTP
jgi:hypothetical protein